MYNSVQNIKQRRRILGQYAVITGQVIPLICLTLCSGRAMAQAVSCRPLTVEAQVHVQINPCGICGGQSGTGTGFSLSSLVFPIIYHSTITLQTQITWEMNNMSTSGSSSEM
jgi:hypothetical protein